MAEMTIQQALIELKTLPKRIEKKIGNVDYTVISKNQSVPVGFHDIKAYCDHVKNEYKAINDLIAREQNIKSAIIKSNSETKVLIGDKEMTVAEAITYKDKTLNTKKALRNNMANHLMVAVRDYEKHKEKLDSDFNELVKIRFGKDGQTSAGDEYTKAHKNFYGLNTVEFVDPLNLNKTLEGLDKEISDFEKNVDYALTVSNVKTIISVD